MWFVPLKQYFCYGRSQERFRLFFVFWWHSCACMLSDFTNLSLLSFCLLDGRLSRALPAGLNCIWMDLSNGWTKCWLRWVPLLYVAPVCHNARKRPKTAPTQRSSNSNLQVLSWKKAAEIISAINILHSICGLAPRPCLNTHTHTQQDILFRIELGTLLPIFVKLLSPKSLILDLFVVQIKCILIFKVQVWVIGGSGNTKKYFTNSFSVLENACISNTSVNAKWILVQLIHPSFWPWGNFSLGNMDPSVFVWGVSVVKKWRWHLSLSPRREMLNYVFKM